jgi:hypothetical protein
MRLPIQEANDFLNANKDLQDEMNRYHVQRGDAEEEINEFDDKVMNQYHRLKTYILEKKMGLLTGNK